MMMVEIESNVSSSLKEILNNFNSSSRGITVELEVLLGKRTY